MKYIERFFDLLQYIRLLLRKFLNDGKLNPRDWEDLYLLRKRFGSNQ